MFLDASHSVLLLLLVLHLCSKSKMKDFGGETPYSIMFGPDICGFGTRKTHVIFNYKEKNHLVKKDIKCETDQLSHVYTLRLMPNNTYEVGTAGLCQPAS
jgi:calreticulin